jgi:transposase
VREELGASRGEDPLDRHSRDIQVGVEIRAHRSDQATQEESWIGAIEHGERRSGLKGQKTRGLPSALRRYRRRWKIERLFAWLQNYRHLTVRWEYRLDNFLGMLHLACALILMRHL